MAIDRLPATRLMNMREAGVYLGVSADTVRRLIAKGAIPAYRIGERRLHLRQADLDAYVTSRALGGPPKPASAPSNSMGRGKRRGRRR